MTETVIYETIEFVGKPLKKHHYHMNEVRKKGEETKVSPALSVQEEALPYAMYTPQDFPEDAPQVEKTPEPKLEAEVPQVEKEDLEMLLEDLPDAPAENNTEAEPKAEDAPEPGTVITQTLEAALEAYSEPVPSETAPEKPKKEKRKKKEKKPKKEKAPKKKAANEKEAGDGEQKEKKRKFKKLDKSAFSLFEEVVDEKAQLLEDVAAKINQDGYYDVVKPYDADNQVTIKSQKSQNRKALLILFAILGVTIAALAGLIGGIVL